MPAFRKLPLGHDDCQHAEVSDTMQTHPLEYHARARGAFMKPDNTARPKLKAPPGTCDTHMHIYDRRYPKAATARIDAPDAPVSDYLKVRERLGIERIVVVQPSTYGTDNRCTIEAMKALGAGTRGVAVVDQTVTDAELDRLTGLGIRGIRFFMLPGGALPWDILETMAARVAPFGWHGAAPTRWAPIAGLRGGARAPALRSGDRSCRQVSRAGAGRASELSRARAARRTRCLGETLRAV